MRTAAMASQRPCVGNALNWQGHPHAQLHVTVSSATMRQGV
jgi:hypothetical protein